MSEITPAATEITSASVVELLHTSLMEFEQRMEAINQRGQQIAGRTLLIIRIVLFVLGIGTVLIFGVIAYLSSDMRGVVANMIEMYERFGDMSQDVAVITNSVTAIDNNMVGMPAIATRMNHMNQAVSGMRDHVGTMTQNIEQIDTGMVAISQGVADMALRFDHLTLTVHRMNYNVHQMSGPLRAFPGAP